MGWELQRGLSKNMQVFDVVQCVFHVVFCSLQINNSFLISGICQSTKNSTVIWKFSLYCHDIYK